jgi:Carbohydrate kinase/YjeF-related protein N-terminus
MKDRFLVSTAQMQEIESQVFAAGMPIAALMEKVGGLIARRFQCLYPRSQYHRVGILVGMGHNGGDALVVARELYFQGYEVSIYVPISQLVKLTDGQDLDFTKYQAIACGCGLTEKPYHVVDAIIQVNCPIVIDADALNIVAKYGIDRIIHRRTSPTILTPHLGEFKRLFPNISPFAERDAHEALSLAIACRRHSVRFAESTKL